MTLDELLKESMSVIPLNILRAVLNIGNLTSQSLYLLFSLHGKMVQSGSLLEGNNCVNQSQLSSGTYFLSLYYSNKASQF